MIGLSKCLQNDDVAKINSVQDSFESYLQQNGKKMNSEIIYNVMLSVYHTEKWVNIYSLKSDQV